MKEYNAHFSYYSELYGNFTETTVKVEAENQFVARRLAWEQLYNDDEIKNFASCVKLCGITWDASKLDMQDYFNAQAAYDKYRLQYIDNVEIPNAEMENNKETRLYYEKQKYEHYGSLSTIYTIAEDFGKPYGLLPPNMSEEIHFAKEFLKLIGEKDYDTYDAFSKLIEQAENWDGGALISLRELFSSGYALANGHELDFSKQLVKGGLYPVHADRTDFASSYVMRWTNAREYKNLASLPVFGEKDIVTNSTAMQYDWQTLVLKKEALPPERQTPINSLWIANQGSAGNFDKDGDGLIVAENPMTGEIAEWNRSDCHGVLRPEKNAKIDFNAIKAELSVISPSEKECIKSNAPERTNNGKKPSLLGELERNKAAIPPPTAKAASKNNHLEV